MQLSVTDQSVLSMVMWDCAVKQIGNGVNFFLNITTGI